MTGYAPRYPDKEMIALGQAQDNNPSEHQISNNYGRRYKESFEAVYRDLAKDHKVPLVSSLVEGVPLEESYFQSDYLHPNSAAQPLMLANVWQQLQKILVE